MAKDTLNRTIYFLVPVYNEAKNIPLLYEGLKSATAAYKKQFVFSDDGSSDNTAGVIEEVFKNEKVIILGDGNNHGPGHAFNTGFDWILEQSHHPDDIIVTIESDNTSDVEILSDMIAISDLDYDLVLASVYAQGGGFEETSFFRKLISFVANIILRLLFDIKVLTLSSFYRVYSVELLRKIKLKYGRIIQEPGFLSMIELLIKSIRVEADIVEVPMKLYSTRRIGKSKMKIFKTTMRYLKFMISNKL